MWFRSVMGYGVHFGLQKLSARKKVWVREEYGFWERWAMWQTSVSNQIVEWFAESWVWLSSHIFGSAVNWRSYDFQNFLTFPPDRPSSQSHTASLLHPIWWLVNLLWSPERCCTGASLSPILLRRCSFIQPYPIAHVTVTTDTQVTAANAYGSCSRPVLRFIPNKPNNNEQTILSH